METHARYFLIGVFSLVVTLGLILFVLWLGKLQLDRDYQEYDVRFHESVTGLSVGGVVQYQGVQVGEVRKLALDQQDPREVSVRIRVAATTPIKTDTQAQLAYTGLTGVAVVELFGGSPQAPLLRVADASHAPRIDAVPSSLSELMSGGSGAMRSVETTLRRIDQTLNDENQARVSRLLDNLDSLSQSAREDYPELRAALTDARAIERRLDMALQRSDALLAQMQAAFSARPGEPQGNVFEQVRSGIVDVRHAATALQRLAAASEHTVSGIDGTVRTELVETLGALQEASENLARMTRRFDEAPREYLLGGESLPLYEPEAER
jgi:phospholipid/cholesterol/gamma-HCH transport system substrate-binding protein